MLFYINTILQSYTHKTSNFLTFESASLLFDIYNQLKFKRRRVPCRTHKLNNLTITRLEGWILRKSNRQKVKLSSSNIQYCKKIWKDGFWILSSQS